MSKVNEFETARYHYNLRHQRFSDENNLTYTYPSKDRLIDNPKDIAGFILHHKEHQKPRLQTLERYYEGKNSGILDGVRRKEDHLSDHRAPHNFAKYTSQFIQGYLVGIPLKTTSQNEEVDERIKDLNRTNDADAHNSDLVLDLSIYGRAFELLYRNQEDENRFTVSKPIETFVIYDDTVERRPIAGVRYISNPFLSDTETVYVYTDDTIYTYKTVSDSELQQTDVEAHHFEGVPIIEYVNDRFRQGDFEDVLSLIDLYDAAQSDTANYMSDLNDAMLVIAGNIEMDFEDAKKHKEANLLFLESSLGVDGGVTNTPKADYIYKQYDVSGTESYKDRVQADIHKFTNTPDMTDEKFAGTQSGEAMRFKLFGLEQKRSTKERFFIRSLRQRYRLLNNVMTTSREGGFDVNDLTITFTPNLPKSLVNEVEMFNKLGGELSEETKLSILSIVDNPQEEMDRMKAESIIRREDRDPYPLREGGVEVDENEQG